MHFPNYRPRRLRSNKLIRDLVQETQLTVKDLIMPLFVRPGSGIKKEILTMPGNYQFSVDTLVEEVKELASLGIPGVILFGIPSCKDELGTEAYAEDGIIQKAVRAIKENVSDILVITDVCMCEYTNHGHCGFIKKDEKIEIPILEIGADVEEKQLAKTRALRKSRDNDKVTTTLEKLSKACNGDENIMPLLIDAANAYATLGEMVDAMKSVFGEWTETSVI